MRKLHDQASRLLCSLLTLAFVWRVAQLKSARQVLLTNWTKWSSGLALIFLFMMVSVVGMAQTRMVATTGADVGDCTGAPCLTINYAVLQANPGDDILIDDGTYNENVLVNKNDLFFHSINGASAVTVQGASGGPSGTFQIANVTGTTLGDYDEGFTILGYDNPAPAVEHAAVYANGDWSNTTIRGNIITADGEAGFLSEFASTGTNVVFDYNTLDGQTFVGPEPGECDFSMQFTAPNVPRQLAVFGPNVSGVTFTNNTITGVTGGFNVADGCPQGNTLVTIDSDNSTITNNVFNGTTSRFATSLRVRGDAASISCNVFDNSGLMNLTAHIFIDDANGDPLSGASPSTIAGICQQNLFTDDGAFVDPPGRPDAGLYPYYIYKSVADATAALPLYNAPARTATQANVSMLDAACCQVLDFTRNELNRCSGQSPDFTITNISTQEITFDIVFEDAVDIASFPKDLNLENALPYTYTSVTLAGGASINTIDLIPAPVIINEDFNFDRGRILMGLINIVPDNPSPTCMYDDIGPGTGLGLGSIIYPDPVVEAVDPEICTGESVDIDVDLSFPSIEPSLAGYPVEIAWTSVNNPNVAGNSNGSIQIYDATGAETQMADITDVLVNGGVSPEIVEYSITPTSAGPDGTIGTADDCVGDPIMVTATVYPEISAALGADRVEGCYDFANTGGMPTTDFDLSVFYLGGTTLGGTWTYVAGPGGAITNNTFTGGPGCHTLEYTVDAGYPGANPACVAMTDQVLLLLTEEPQPDFDIQDAVCWDGVDGSINLTTNYNGQTFGTESTRTYAWTATLNSGAGPIPSFSDATAMEPTVSILGAGEFEICLDETLTYAACGSVAAGEVCTNQICHILTVTETAIEVDPSWTTPGPFCVDDLPIDLDILVTGDANGEFTGTGVGEAPTAPDYSFEPATAGVGSHSICYTVNNGAGCTAVECHIVEVYPAAVINLLGDLTVSCQPIDGNGFVPGFDLNNLLAAGSTEGGTWSLLSGPGLIINDGIVGAPGCFEVQYSVSSFPSGDGACMATASQFVRITEQTRPGFDLSEAICWDGVPGSINLPTLYNGQTTGTSATINYDWTATLNSGAGPIPTFSDATAQEPMVQIQGAGEFEICLTESLDYAACGGLAALTDVCSETICHILTVTETAVEVSASWTLVDATCEDDMVIDLDALVTGDANGVFSGPGVSEAPTAPNYSFDPSMAGTGTHNICYTVNNGAGCTAVECHTIEVFGPATIDFFGGGTFTLLCEIPRGDGRQPLFDLSIMLNAGTTPGGTWTALSGPGNVVNGFLSGTAGCYQLEYSVESAPGLDGACAATETMDFRMTEEPTPAFDLAEQVCWDGTAGSVVLPTLYNGNTFGNNATINYDWSATLISGAGPIPSFSNAMAQEPSVVIEGAGQFEICLTESLDYPACGALPALTDYCAMTVCHTLTVSETAVEVDAAWTTIGDLCLDDLCVDLDDLVTGDADGVFSGTGVIENPSAPDYCFDPGMAGAGSHTICYTVNNGAGCTAVECHTIEVFPAAVINLFGDATVSCQPLDGNNFFERYELSGILNAGTTEGGTWTLLSGPGLILNEGLIGVPGCFEVQYEVSTFDGADGACTATASQFLRITEQPTPDFDIAQEVCWDGVAASITLPTSYTGNTQGSNATINYDWSVTTLSGAGPAPTFSDAMVQEPMVTVQGAGQFEICLTESLDYAACGSMGALTDHCPEISCHILTVTETAVEVSAAWTAPGPFCEDDLSVDLDALVTGDANGVFSGTGVVEDMTAPDYAFEPATAGPGLHNICYTVNNGAGCTAVECHVIEVFPGVTIDGEEFTALQCAVKRSPFNFVVLPSGSTLVSDYSSGQYNLDDLLSGDSKRGGTWTLISTPDMTTPIMAPNGEVFGGNLYYTDPGCYEVEYSVECFPGADGDCVASMTFFVQIGECPTAQFDMPDSYCLEDGDLPFTLDIGQYFMETVFHPTSTQRRSYGFTSSNPAIISPATAARTTNADFMPQIVGQGTVEICVSEGLENAPGGTCGTTQTFCSQLYCQTITIVSASETLDPSWGPAGPYCIDDECIDLDALVTGTPNGVFTGNGVMPAPSNPDYEFCPADAGVGVHAVTYTVATPEGCESSLTINIEVFDAADATIGDIHLECQEDPNGALALTAMFGMTTTPGGTFTILDGPVSGSIAGGSLIYTEAGCYEIEYSVESFPGADGSCLATASAFVLISEEPAPDFDLAEQVCWDGVVGSITLPTIYNGTTMGNNATATYSWEATLISGAGPIPSFSDAMAMEPMVSIEGAGQFEICLTETLDYMACGTNVAGSCEATVCHTLTVTETAIEVDASWTSVGPFCEDDARVYLGASSTGMGAGQVTGDLDGVFTGDGVVEDPVVSGEYYFDPMISGPGNFDICYTVNNGAGCTAIECHNLLVGEEVVLDCQDNVVLPCATTPLGSQQTFGPFSSSLSGTPFPQIVVIQSDYTLGTFSLEGLLCPGTTQGGEWSLVEDAPGSPVGIFASGAVQGSVLYFTAPGCYEVNYTVSSIKGLDGACVADQNFFVTIGESPSPSFDLPDEVCWSSGGPTLTYDIEEDYLTSPEYINDVIRSYSSSDDAVASVDGDGVVTINGDGTATICMVEFIATSECDGFDFTTCQVEICEVITVFETSTTVNPAWTAPGPYCVDDVRVYLGANENGMGCGLVTGTCGGVFTGQGVVEDPAGSEEYYFDPTMVTIPAGQEFAEIDVCYTVNNGAGCTATECHAIRVYAPVNAQLIGDATLGCQNFNNGISPFIYFDLNRLLGPDATVGGTWTSTEGTVNGNILIAVPGCTEITYTVEAFVGADGSCTATETMFLRLTENPTPAFDVAEEVCWDGVPGSISLPIVYNGQTFGDNGTILYDWTVNTVSGGPAPTFSDAMAQEPMVSIQGAGVFEICLTQSIEYPACGSLPEGEFCNVTVCHTMTVTETAVEVIPTWTPIGPFCEDDARTYLGAAEAGMGCGQVTGTCDGVFTGEGVVEDPAGSGEYYFDPTLVMIPMDEEFVDISVCYTVNNGSGCTATECHNVRVYAGVMAAMNDIHIECQVAPTGNVDLNGLLTPETTLGGTFTLLSGPASATISNTLLIYSEAGCYEIEYTVTAFDGADGACTTTTSGFVLISEQPQPSFDIQDQVCFSDGDADLMLTPLVNSPTYDMASIVSTNWDVIDNVTGAVVTIDEMTGIVTISDEAGPSAINGSFEVCYVEEIEWEACGSFPATIIDANGDGCAQSFCLIVTVEDGTALDAGFTVDNDEPCPGDVVMLTANTNGGVFTGLNVTDNGDGMTGTLQIDSCGTYAVTYTISSPNGCTNSLTLNIQTDRTAPVVVPPADTLVECDGMGNIAAMEEWLDRVTGSDNCTFTIDTMLFNRISGCSENTGEYVYQFIGTDTCGNQTIEFATFTIQDTTPPEIMGGADMLMEECTAPPAGNFPEFDFWLESNAGATASDSCGGRVFWSNDFDPANWMQVCGNARFVDVTFYAEDECNNVDSITHRFAIGDVTPPEFSNCPRDIITAAAPPTWCEAFVNFSPPSATDNCSSVTLTRLDSTGLNSGDLFPVGITVLTWEARDSCDNADTCSLKIVVNDYHTPPTIECPGDASANTDLGICGADVSTQLGIDLSPTGITDNCPDNLAVTYEVTDENGEIVGCGIETVNGFIFPTGTNTVTYRIQDQPILLLTEIVQDGPDAVEVTNFGPASMDISCLVIERFGAGAEQHIVPINTVLMAGETYVANLMNDIAYTDAAVYTMSLKGTVLDQIMTNNLLDGGDIWRTRICDHDTEEDWLVTVECKASLGMVNPGLPVFPSNGTQTGIQTVLPSFDVCDFMVTVSDNEPPVCAMIDTATYQGPEVNFTGQECVMATINVADALTVGGVIVNDLQITYPVLGELAASLIGPDGTEVQLFYRPCTDVPDMLASFSDAGVQQMSAAGCMDPLNTGLLWIPVDSLKAFYGKSAQGDWTLELSVDGPATGSIITGWSIDILALEPFDNTPIVVPVDSATAPDMCGAEVTWTHPVLQDNCCEGTMIVEYSTLDADTLPTGGAVMSGATATEFFGLGTTTVKYTLTDAAGNQTMCSIDIIVEDPLGLCVPPCMSNCNVSCIQDINVSLNENCIVPVVPSMVSEAINADCDFYYDIEILDEHGNILPSDTLNSTHVGRCFTVRLIEPECGNSCWTEVCVEDKFPPIIECRDDTLSCVEYQNNFAEPTAVEHCGNYTVRLVDELITNMDCDTMFQKLITQKWVAEDDHGNVSDTCVQSLFIERFPLDDVRGPVMDTSIYCGSGYPVDANGNPHPDATGIPRLNGLALWPMTDFFCNLTVEYRDIDLGTIGCTQKILRDWTVREWWCRSDEDRGFQQFIYITDTVGPVLNIGPDTIYAKAGRRSCDALVDMPVADVNDACHAIDRVDMVYPGGFAGAQNGGQIRLGVGLNTVYYRAYDACYNETIDSIVVMVEDQVAPIAICEQNTVISLDNDGIVHVYAQAFDDGSFDECALEKMEVRRMTDNCNGGTDQWGDYVEFCCADLNQTVMVAFRVTDKSGNVGTCMVSATVQDKLPPVFTSLPDITVDCRFDLDSNHIADAFGTYVYADSLRQPIVIDDPYVVFDGPALDGLVRDNCPPIMKDSMDYGGIDNCGTGFLNRYFWFYDLSGNTVYTDTQTITVVNHEPFTELQIIWPLDVDTMNVCGAVNLNPDFLPLPQAFPRFVDEDECSLVGYDYKDELQDASQGSEACYKIFRTWTVIDWCQKENNVHKKWTYEQVISVSNTNAPVITTECVDTVRCVFNATCEPDSFELTAQALDDCTIQEDLYWTYKIDLDNNGTFDIVDNGNDATGLYPIGVHRIKWIVEDLCGNQDSCSFIFELRNCKAPTAYCRNGVVAELTPMDLDNDGTPDTEMAEVWASDFDENSGHSCGHPVVLSFSADTSDKVRMYDCDSLTPPNRDVTIWVTDKVTGEVSKCKTFVLVQDNNGVAVCDTTTFGGGVISGQLYTEDDQMIRDVMVELNNSGQNGIMTNDQGEYAFSSMPFGGQYEVIPSRNVDFFNGVSTADIVAIQRHLLGKQELNSPYKLIAADINRSQTVSAADISELRKFILGVYNEFPNNTSWRFVDEAYVFPDPKNPWAEIFPETYDIDPFVHDMDIDFIGVKIGDVTGDVDLGGFNQSSPRSVRNLMMEDGDVRSGNSYEVMINMDDLSDLEGYQFTLEWKSEYLELVEVVPNLSLGMNLGNFGLNRVDQGIITTSWNKKAKDVKDGEERLFLLKFKGLKSGRLSEIMTVSSQVTAKESYVEGLSQIEDIELSFTGGEANTYFALYQNEPNPWGDQTVISFHLPEAQSARLTIFDENGREIRVFEGDYDKGFNEITVRQAEFSVGGLMYYRLETNDHVATRKMILID